MLATLLLCAAGFAAEISAPVAPKAPSLIILPDSAAFPPAQGLALPQGLILPAAAPILAPDGAPATAQKAIQLATPADLARMTARGPGSQAAPGQPAPAEAAGSIFDGSHAPSAQDWEAVRRPNVFFAGGPRAPELPVLDATARGLFQRLLPRLYRPVPVRTAGSDEKFTGAYHYWSEEDGHVIEFKPGETDPHGQVESAFGQPGTIVQQKIEYLMQYLHEYSHAIFDEGVRKRASHGVHSAHAAMTEGFAVTAERLLIEGLLDNAPSLGMTPRDADDLRRIGSARQRWLKEEDNAYSEGEPVWRRAYEAAGHEGVLSLLSSLSARRLIETPRADPAYQLSLSNNELLSAYLGKNSRDERRLGLEAYDRAAKGEALFLGDAGLAAAVVAEAGPPGRRRVFDRFLGRAVAYTDGSGRETWFVPAWLRGSDSATPAFALAELDEQARGELAEYLAEMARTPKGLDRLFEKAGPSQRLIDVVSEAEKLTWKPADRAAWNAAVTAWLTKATPGVRP